MNLEERVKRLERIVLESYGCKSHDFLKIMPELKEVDKVKVSKIDLINKTRVRVTLESNGHEFTFAGDIFEICYNLDGILKHWKRTVIPRRLAMEQVDEQTIREKLKELEGLEI